MRLTNYATAMSNQNRFSSTQIISENSLSVTGVGIPPVTDLSKSLELVVTVLLPNATRCTYHGSSHAKAPLAARWPWVPRKAINLQPGMVTYFYMSEHFSKNNNQTNKRECWGSKENSCKICDQTMQLRKVNSSTLRIICLTAQSVNFCENLLTTQRWDKIKLWISSL